MTLEEYKITKLSYGIWKVEVLDNDLSKDLLVYYDVPRKLWRCTCGSVPFSGRNECKHIKAVKERMPGE